MMKINLMVCFAAYLQSKHFALMVDEDDGWWMMADNSDGLFCCISAKQTLCTDGFLFTSMMIDLVEKLSCANCFLATIFRRNLNIGILAHSCLSGSDVSVQVGSIWRCYLREILGGHQQCLKITDERFLWCVSGNFR